MRFEINNLKQSLKDIQGGSDIEIVRMLAAKRLKLSESDISDIRILKRSVDARDKRDVLLIYSAEVEAAGDMNLSRYRQVKDIVMLGGQEQKEDQEKELACRSRRINNRPIIIGSGPAGLFAGLILAKQGYRPLILERGADVDKRAEAIDAFFRLGAFDEDSNIQFGEGGAGTFSDGKLTTRIKDKRIGMVLNT
ncbi:MAG TPA: FAD-dependent monooxygenase, partial [Candidatus Nitrosocosmicus sp.]|nr:FAD-dependent monooxygenase [Candidatus Nitrosocosmicus sp.]